MGTDTGSCRGCAVSPCSWPWPRLLSPSLRSICPRRNRRMWRLPWRTRFTRICGLEVKVCQDVRGVEHSERFAVFKANLKKIAEHNKLYEAGEETFHMAVNQFADMTSEEFAAWSKKANGYRADLRDTNLKSVPTRPLAPSARN